MVLALSRGSYEVCTQSFWQLIPYGNHCQSFPETSVVPPWLLFWVFLLFQTWNIRLHLRPRVLGFPLTFFSFGGETDSWCGLVLTFLQPWGMAFPSSLACWYIRGFRICLFTMSFVQHILEDEWWPSNPIFSDHMWSYLFRIPSSIARVFLDYNSHETNPWSYSLHLPTNDPCVRSSHWMRTIWKRPLLSFPTQPVWEVCFLVSSPCAMWTGLHVCVSMGPHEVLAKLGFSWSSVLTSTLISCYSREQNLLCYRQMDCHGACLVHRGSSKSLGPNFPGLLSTVKHAVRTMACRMGVGDQDMIAQSKAWGFAEDSQLEEGCRLSASIWLGPYWEWIFTLLLLPVSLLILLILSHPEAPQTSWAPCWRWLQVLSCSWKV